MNRNFLFCLIFIAMLALVGCSTQDTNPAPKGPTRVGSITSLQSAIDDASSGDVLDLSQCSSSETMNFTVDKPLTFQNGDRLSSCNLTISAANVTINNSTLGKVSTTGSGSSNLKISNSSLSTLSLNGDGVGRGEGRGDSKPSVTLVGSTVSVKVELYEAVELKLENFASNIKEFVGNAAAKIRMFKDAYNNEKDKIAAWVTKAILDEEDMFDDDDLFGEISKAGPAGKRLQYESGYFPNGAARYVGKLVEECVNIPDFPDVTADECSYFMLTADDFYKQMGFSYSNAIDGRFLEVKIPQEKFDPEAYGAKLKQNGFVTNGDNCSFTVTNLGTRGNVNYIFNISINDKPDENECYSVVFFSFKLDIKQMVRNVLGCFFGR